MRKKREAIPFFYGLVTVLMDGPEEYLLRALYYLVSDVFKGDWCLI